MGSIDQFLRIDQKDRDIAEPTKAEMQEHLDRITAEMEGVAESFDDCTTAAKEAVESFPKVVLCAGCDEYAFDGTMTAFETDDGVQGFCLECVRGIEKRSRQPIKLGSGDIFINDVRVGGLQSAELNLTYPTWTDNRTLNTSITPTIYGGGVN